jgi:hypothetical protein
VTRAGVAVVQGADRWWAWAASHVAPTGTSPAGTTDGPRRNRDSSLEPATTHNEHFGQATVVVQAGDLRGGVHLHGDTQPAPAPDDTAWLRSCWEAAAATGATIEMRYLTRPSDTSLDGFLVVRAEGADRDDATSRVASLRQQVCVLPGHVAATPVTDEDETHRVLEPFRAHGEGIVEVRKRLTVHRTTRDDARTPWLAAVTPLFYQRQSWDPLWSAMAALPFHAMLSVGLVAYPVGAGLRAHLAARTAELARLARHGPPLTAGWSVPRHPDEFAVAAHALMSEAVRRYTDKAFLVRVSVAADRPVPGFLAELVTNTISAPSPNHGFAGAPPVVIRPEPADQPVAWDNITALNFAPLSAYSQGHPAEAVGDLEQVLSAIVDLDEASSAFRLPYRGLGQRSPFTVREDQ